MKKILGLDLGTNSIGWALIEIDHEEGKVRILGLGSRILPMDAGEIKDFESMGKINSTAAQRTEKRGIRRLNERYLLRRDRLHLVLNLLEALPKHYQIEIDFANDKGEKCGKFKENREPKLAYLPKKNGSKAEFIFKESYQEMLDDIGIENKKGNRIPYDWTLYYLRQKALNSKISLEELAWILLSYNQKRGYEKTEVEDKSTNSDEIIEEFDLRVKAVVPRVNNNVKYFEIHLDSNDNLIYNEFSEIQMTFENDLKEIIKRSKVDEKGNIDRKNTKFTVIDIYTLKIKDVDHVLDNGKHKYTITFQNGWQEEKQTKTSTFRYKNSINKSFDYIVETVYDSKGNFKTVQGKARKLREPDFGENSSDWTLLKKKTEKEALEFNIEQGYKNENGGIKKFISPKIYDTLKNDAVSGYRTKLIGGIFQVVDREFYRQELNQILATQKKYHTNLGDEKIYKQCVNILYPKNENHRKALMNNKNAIQHLLVEDVLLYQRPLKSKKSEIDNCKYEIRHWKEIEEVDKKTGEIKTFQKPFYRKAASVSHPYFQEFRIWDKMHNLKLIQLENINNDTGEISTNVDVTKDYLKGEEEYQLLFNKLNSQKAINQDQFLKFCRDKLGLPYNKNEKNFVWNFPEDEEIKGNETRVSFATRFKRCGFKEYHKFLTQEKELDLWHYLFSVNYKERTANNNKSIITFFKRFLEGSQVTNEIIDKIINDFINYPKFPSKYCAYSEKALKKLLPLIRKGISKDYDWFSKGWYQEWKQKLIQRENEILKKLKAIDFSAEKIDYSKAINVDVDLKNGEIPFPKGLFNTFKTFTKIQDFQHLNISQASYLAYGRHSELAQLKYWNSPRQIRDELHQELKHNSLNNPIAEKVILEMMQIVADIWDYYGKGSTGYFTEIHVEVGRELKKSAKEKEDATKRQSNNRAQNKRLRQILTEFLSKSPYNAEPINPDHFERLKIVEDGAEHTGHLDKDFFNNYELKNKGITKKSIDDILHKAKLEKEDFDKYKLWIEQGYRSPYTNCTIKLTDLFDGNKYNIDHVFPQAMVTNNSQNNKVVCEREVNKLKSNQTGRDFVNNPRQRKVYCNAHGKEVSIINDENYVNIVKAQFSGNKKHILLSRDIPKGFTNSQLNNTRYIARKAMELLSHIVREPGEVEFRSKNVLPVTGAVTGILKDAWKMDHVWKELVAPRFIRLNELTKSTLFGEWQTKKNNKKEKYFDCNLDKIIRDKDESYNIKRIDHRHHALDALIVALCTKEHVQYLNNINADKKLEKIGDQKKLESYRKKLKRKIMFSKPKKESPDENDWFFMLPGEIRKEGAVNSRGDSVLTKSYYYKEFDSFGDNYKRMIFTALQHTIVTFKQNLRVINKAANFYNNTPNRNQFVKQVTEKNGNRENWAIRRSLGKDSYYGKKRINGEDRIVIRKELDSTFTKDKINLITDTGIQKILFKHMEQFDTVDLNFHEAINYYDALLEKVEIDAIVSNDENEFNTKEDFFYFLESNKYKYNKVDYSKLQVFVDKVSDRNFRIEEPFKNKIKEHPEIAFTQEEIEEMNKPIRLRELNDGKNHAPIKKVRISRGFGKQRQISGNIHSVKNKQYVVTNEGSNLFLGVYKRIKECDENESEERKFEEINLIDLIEILKQDKSNRNHPLPDRIFDAEQNKYDRIFTLSPLDLVYVPTEEEIDNPSLVRTNNLTNDQIDRIYKYVDGNNEIANFVPYSIAKPIWRFHGNKKKSIFKELKEENKISVSEKELIQNEFGLGSQQNKNQNMIDGKTQIKKKCWKIEMDRLGNIQKIVR